MMHMRSIGIWNRVMEICCLAGSIRLFIMCTMEQFNVVLCPSLPSLLPCSCVVSEISTNSGWPLNAKKDVTGSQLSNKRKMISAAGWCCLSGSNKRWLHWLDRRWMITSCKKTTLDEGERVFLLIIHDGKDGLYRRRRRRSATRGVHKVCTQNLGISWPLPLLRTGCWFIP